MFGLYTLNPAQVHVLNENIKQTMKSLWKYSVLYLLCNMLFSKSYCTDPWIAIKNSKSPVFLSLVRRKRK